MKKTKKSKRKCWHYIIVSPKSGKAIAKKSGNARLCPKCKKWYLINI